MVYVIGDESTLLAYIQPGIDNVVRYGKVRVGKECPSPAPALMVDLSPQTQQGGDTGAQFAHQTWIVPKDCFSAICDKKKKKQAIAATCTQRDLKENPTCFVKRGVI